ncbi:hypothetical protein BDW60DRAFT_216696 [Aspergillus nidulans var. acristatus]
MPNRGSVILQSTLLKTAANLMVQVAKIWSHNESALQGVEWLSVAEFAVCGVIQAEIGWHWHNFLEDAFPTSQPEAPNDYEKQNHRGRKEYWLHIFFKLMLDQTAGSFAMNTVFIICTTAARVSSLNTLGVELDKRIWPLVLDAWKIWPAAALANFLWVPVDWRVLVSSCVGFAWNIFLSIRTLARQEA